LDDELARVDGDRVLARQLAERVADELEVLRPEQRDQVVGSFRLEVLRLLQHAEEADDLPVFDARLERQRADAVLVQRPCDALAMGALAVDDHVLPAQLGLVDVEHQPVRDLPDLDRKSTRLNSSHQIISYAVFCLKKKKINRHTKQINRTTTSHHM